MFKESSSPLPCFLLVCFVILLICISCCIKNSMSFHVNIVDILKQRALNFYFCRTFSMHPRLNQYCCFLFCPNKFVMLFLVDPPVLFYSVGNISRANIDSIYSASLTSVLHPKEIFEVWFDTKKRIEYQLPGSSYTIFSPNPNLSHYKSHSLQNSRINLFQHE